MPIHLIIYNLIKDKDNGTTNNFNIMKPETTGQKLDRLSKGQSSKWSDNVDKRKTMNKIDYEVEVKRVYPDAYGQRMMGIYLIVDGANDGKPIGELSNSVKSSWKSAYERIQSVNQK